jgi:AraC-like DNA-binding protein
LGQLELLRATFINHSFSRHTHEGFAIGVIEAGAEQFAYRGETHIAPETSIVIINPGEVHTGRAGDGSHWTYRMLYPAADRLQEIASQLGERPRDVPFFPCPVIHDPPLARVLRQLHVALEAGGDRLQRESLLHLALAQLIDRHADSRPPSKANCQDRPAVVRVRNYLETHFADIITLERLAAIAHLSPHHLLRVFQQQTGLTPYTYLTQVRLRQAKMKLLAGGAIAQEIGFVDQSHLTKHFKRAMGIAPKQYVRGSKNVQECSAPPFVVL